MKISYTGFVALFVAIAALSGVAYSQSLSPSAAASVNGNIITNDAVEQGIQVALSQGQKDSPELRNLVLGKLIEISLLSQQAERDGLANSDKANLQLAQIRQNYLADLELATFIAQNPVTDSDIQNAYKQQVSSLGPQGLIVEYKVSDIAVATEEDAKAALARMKKGEPFDKVAKSISLAPNKVQGGAVGWVQLGQVAPQIASVLAALAAGQVSPLPINDAAQGKPFDTTLLGNLEGLANRGYTDGFYERHHDKDYQLYMRGYSLSGRSLYVGETLEIDSVSGRVKVDVKNRFSVGDKLEIIEPQGNQNMVLENMWNMKGESITVAPGSGHFVWIELPLSSKHAYIARYTNEPAKVEAGSCCDGQESCSVG